MGHHSIEVDQTSSIMKVFALIALVPLVAGKAAVPFTAFGHVGAAHAPVVAHAVHHAPVVHHAPAYTAAPAYHAAPVVHHAPACHLCPHSCLPGIRWKIADETLLFIEPNIYV